jgi:Plasmid pRiA4b ORF-3-like protein
MTDPGPRLLQLKMLLRDVHPAVWRRVRLADELSIAELHRVIQILMGWDDDHLHRFRIHGRDYGIAYIGGPNFGEDAAAVPLSLFGFRPTERFDTVQNLGGLMRHGETGDGPIAQQSCDRC